MAGPVDFISLFAKELPSSLTVHNGDTITGIVWREADEPSSFPKKADGSANFPFGTFAIISQVPDNITGRVGRPRYEEEEVLQTPTYTSNVTDYALSQDLIRLVSVTGTLSGNPHTFVEGTDFIITHIPNQDLVPSILRWMPLGDKPDDSTPFSIDYRYPRVYEGLLDRSIITVRVALYCGTLDDGERGATEYWTKTRLAMALGEALVGKFRLNSQGKALTGTPELQFGPVSTLGVVDVDRGDSHVRYTMDVRLRRLHIMETEVRRTQRVDDYDENVSV